MLSFLHVENIAVIKRLDLELSRGFTALTGETGAGKSIIIDSISLLTGSRASRDLIRSGEEYAYVSALFSNIDDMTLKKLEELDIIPDEEGIVSVSRKIYADGRSTAKINMGAVQLSQLREAAKYLISIQSQNENRDLADPSNHIKYLDVYANEDSDMHAAREKYEKCFDEYKECRAKFDAIVSKESEKERMRELLEYQIKDIGALSLKHGEDAALELRRLKLQNAEKLIKGCEFVYRALSNGRSSLCAADLVEKAESALLKLADFVPEAAQLAEKLGEYKYEIADIGERVKDFVPDDIDDASAELDRIEDRLDKISRLKRKYGQTVDEILEFKHRAECELDEIENSEELKKEAQKNCSLLAEELKKAAEKLHEIRATAGARLEVSVVDGLEYLDMHGARFKIAIELVKDIDLYTRSGADRVEFLIAANPGEELKSMSKTASGGELSRVMLALKSELAGADFSGTIIFDEIDTGVSGKTSEKIGRKLKKISKGAQVLCITHSAQVAALADTHMRISKEENNGRNETNVTVLDFEERVRETARITSGVNISEKQLEAAREMVCRADTNDD